MRSASLSTRPRRAHRERLAGLAGLVDTQRDVQSHMRPTRTSPARRRPLDAVLSPPLITPAHSTRDNSVPVPLDCRDRVSKGSKGAIWPFLDLKSAC